MREKHKEGAIQKKRFVSTTSGEFKGYVSRVRAVKEYMYDALQHDVIDTVMLSATLSRSGKRCTQHHEQW